MGKGGLLTIDKVGPTEIIDHTINDRIDLAITEHDLNNLPDYQVEHFLKLDPDERATEGETPLSWYPPDNSWWRSEFHRYFPRPSYVEETEKDIPEGMIALQQGARVISSDRNHVGDIEKIFVDQRDGRATHIITKGGLFEGKKKLLTAWLSEVDKDEVTLSVDSTFLSRLPDYGP